MRLFTFFLVFGDIFAKAGDLEQASVMYGTAIDLPGSERWPHVDLAEQRIVELEQLPEWFAEVPKRGTQVDATQATIFSGPHNCAVCHASTESSQEMIQSDE